MNNLGISLKDQNSTIDQKTQAPNQLATSSLETSKPKSQILVLDGVRAVACLSVLLYHMSFIAGTKGIWGPVYNTHDVSGIIAFFAASFAYFGEEGVILFFILSGFLLFLPYAKALLFESPWPSWRRFYLRRFFRILPGYFVALFLIALLFHPEFLQSSHWHDLWLFLSFSMNKNLSEQLNGPFWTLAVEFQFYLLLPIIAWLCSLIVRRGTLHWRVLKLTLCLLAMVAWGLLTRYWGIYIANTPQLDFLIPHTASIALIPFIYSDTGKFSEVFAVGMLLCMIYTYTQYAPSGERWRTRMYRLSPLILTVGLALLLFLSLWHFYFIDMNPLHYAKHPKSYIVSSFLDPGIPAIVSRYWPEWQPLGCAIGYGLCLWALLYGSVRLKRPIEWSVLRWVALISFSLYMWHLPFLYVFRDIILPNIRQQGWNPLVQYGAFWCWILLIIIPVSAMLYRWIEQPGIRLGERFIRRLEG
ncbi:MAG TPA: acyltransferase [Ktedonobacteraceae bacterium]